MKKIHNNDYTLQPQSDWISIIQSDNPTIVQVGAHDGIAGEEYGLQEFLDSRQCNVLLVEPVPEFFNNLEQAYKKFKHCNFMFENSAIASTSGTVRLKKEGMCSQISDHGDTVVNSLNWIDLQKKYSLTKIHCLLLDCEGYEETILTELIDYNIIDIPLIRFEYMHIQNKVKVFKHLKTEGYTLSYCMYDPTYNIIATK